MDENDRADIERRAYHRYEERGRSDGDDQADWYEAEQEVRQQRGTRRADKMRNVADEAAGDAREEEERGTRR